MPRSVEGVVQEVERQPRIGLERADSFVGAGDARPVAPQAAAEIAGVHGPAIREPLAEVDLESVVDTPGGGLIGAIDERMAADGSEPWIVHAAVERVDADLELTHRLDDAVRPLAHEAHTDRPPRAELAIRTNSEFLGLGWPETRIDDVVARVIRDRAEVRGRDEDAGTVGGRERAAG